MNNKRYLRALGILFLYCLLIMQWPYTQRSLLTYIVPPLRINSSTFFLSGLISLIIVIWIYKEIVASKQFQASNGVIFIIFIFIVLPFCTRAINFVNDPIYYLHNDVGSIEIEESDIRLFQVDENEYIHINIRIKGHRRLDETFKVNIELDKELLDYIEFIEADDDEKPYRIMVGERKHFEFKLPVKFKEDHSDIPVKNRLDDYDYVINFVGENSTRKHIRNDLY